MDKIWYENLSGWRSLAVVAGLKNQKTLQNWQKSIAKRFVH